MLLPLLDGGQLQREQFSTSQTAPDENGEHGVVAKLAHRSRRPAFKKPSSLLRRQPVSEANSDPPYSLDASNTCRQLRTEKTGVGRLVRDAPNGSEPKVDRGRCEFLLFKVDP
jgi:hypothetical protein